MGLFGGGNKKDSNGEDTAKRLRQKKKTLALDQQIADLQLEKSKLQGKSGGGGWTETWWNEDLDPW